MLYVGGGVDPRAAPRASCCALAELTGIPVVTTLMARGAFPDSHPQHLGMPGMHGTVAAVAALQKSDLIIALGARFDDRVTGKLSTRSRPAPRSSTPTSTRPRSARTATADVPIVGDCREVIADLIAALQAEHGRRSQPATTRRGGATSTGRESATRSATTTPADGSLAPQYVIERLGAIAGPEAIYVAGVGQHQMWAAQFIGYEKPGTWINSGGLGHDGLRGAGGDGRQGRPARRARSGRSTATAASR